MIKLRLPEPRDAGALMDFFNALIEEDAQINHDRKVGYEEEVEWLGKRLAEISSGESLIFVAQDGDKIVGAVDVRRGKFKERHTGELGITVGRDCRNKGLGTKLIKLAMLEAKKIGIKLVWLQVFSTNKKAIKLYKRLGFRKEALLKKRFLYRGKYVDKIVMSRPI